jgi:acyl carrier protein
LVTTKSLKEALIALFHLEGVSEADIGDDDALFNEGLGLDSVDAIELTIFLDNEYGIQFDTMAQSQEAFASIRALQAYINDHSTISQKQK